MPIKKLAGAYMRINSTYANLLPSEKKLADYIVKNKEYVENHSINELAEMAGVSTATVTRFCKHLGYDGFKDFRFSTIKDMKNGRASWADISIKNEDVVDVLIAKTCESNANACLGTELLLDANGLEQAGKLMLEAKRIFIFGEGAVAPIALDFYQKMLRIGVICIYCLDVKMQKMNATLSMPDDVAIIFDLSGYNKVSNNWLKTLKSNGTKTITVCNTIGSPLGIGGDINIFGPGKKKTDVTGTQSPRIALFCIIDCLFNLIFQKSKAECQISLEKTRQVIIGEWI
ncbi:MAG: MurR/RpiR family transcriptional regulator [Clostridia bacterium]